MVVMGFGLGAFLYNNIVKLFAPFMEAARQAAAFLSARAAAQSAHVSFEVARYTMRPEQVGAVMNVFVVSGIVFLILGGLAAALLVNPPEGYTRPGVRAAAAVAERSFTSQEMARTPQFYALWLMLFLNVTAGILFISNAVPIMRELTGAAPALALAAYGAIAVFNGLGRFFWGSVSDRIGRNAAFVLIYALQVVIFFAVPHLRDLAIVATLFAVVLLCYGGGFGTMPSFTADYFGTKFMGLNYGWILLAWGVAGIAGPIFVAYVKDHTGSFSGALHYVALMLIIAAIIPMITRKPGEHAQLPFRPAHR
jgi:nitrate/nitrite transporter NarK